MSKVTTQPYTGPQTIDLTAIAAALVDLPPGAMQGLRREQEGKADVVLELQTNVPALGDKAAISPSVYAEFEQSHQRLLLIRAAKQIVDKAAEVLTESEIYYEDKCEGALSMIAGAVRTSARLLKNDAIMASFEQTLAYNSRAALKAAKTRKKKTAAKQKADSPDAPEPKPPNDGLQAEGGGAPTAP